MRSTFAVSPWCGYEIEREEVPERRVERASKSMKQLLSASDPPSGELTPESQCEETRCGYLRKHNDFE